MKKLLLIIFATGLFVATIGYFTGTRNIRSEILTEIASKNNPKDTVKVGGTKVKVDISDTEESRRQGLSGRPNLPEGEGMLFVFGSEARSAFWMKDMNFAIDIIWINAGRVVGITKDAEPQPGASDSELKLYFPPSAFTQVLEVPSGFSEKNNFKVGDSVTLELAN